MRTAYDHDDHLTLALRTLRQSMSAKESIPPRLDRALRVVCDALDAPLGKVLQLDETKGLLTVRAGVGWREGVVGVATVPAGASSSAGYALRYGHAVIFDDIQRTRRFTDATLLRSHGVMSSISVRIAHGTAVLGVLSVHERNVRHFTSREVGFLESAAVLLAELM